MAAIKGRTLIKEYTICHKGTDNLAFGRVWSVYPSAWLNYKYAGTRGMSWGNVPDNWRDLYDVICKTYEITKTEVVTK